MMIIGCDLHTRYQQIAMLNTETGELTERRLEAGLMPWGLKRFHASGQTHFVTFCCYHRRPLFNAPSPRQVFEAALE